MKVRAWEDQDSCQDIHDTWASTMHHKTTRHWELDMWMKYIFRISHKQKNKWETKQKKVTGIIFANAARCCHMLSCASNQIREVGKQQAEIWQMVNAEEFHSS